MRTGAPSDSARRVTLAAARLAPSPQRSTGRCAARRRETTSPTSGAGGACWVGSSVREPPRDRPASVAGSYWSRTGPGSPDIATSNASSTASAVAPGSGMSMIALTSGPAISCCEIHWSPGPPSSRLVGRAATWTSGTESSRASASPVSAYVKPGPPIVESTPGRPEARAWPIAMNEPVSSFVGTTDVSAELRRRASQSSIVSEPGIPKTCVVPRRASVAQRTSAAVVAMLRRSLGAVRRGNGCHRRRAPPPPHGEDR